jgi:hypothetical protein
MAQWLCYLCTERRQYVNLCSELYSKQQVMNWKWCEKKRSWPKPRYYLGICLEALIKSRQILDSDSRSVDQDTNPTDPGYIAEALPTRTYFRLQQIITSFLQIAPACRTNKESKLKQREHRWHRNHGCLKTGIFWAEILAHTQATLTRNIRCFLQSSRKIQVWQAYIIQPRLFLSISGPVH